MAVSERIVAILQVRNATRFVMTMKEAAHSIEDMTEAERRNTIQGILFSKSQRKAGLSTAALKDHLSLTRGELMTTAITTGLYTAPALIALGNSAVAAAVGGGLVAGGGLAALSFGLAGAGIIAVQAAGQFSKVKSAQDAYNQSVAQYGQDSKQASDASAKLFAVVAQNGGPQVYRAVRAFNSLSSAWRSMSAPGRANMFDLLTIGISRARNLLPAFARETNANTAVIKRDVGGIFTGLSGPEMQRNIHDFSSIFRAMSPHLAGGVTNLFLVILRVLRQAAPWAVTWAESFERTTAAWKRGTSDGLALSDTIDMLVAHTQSWWHLIKAFGGILIELFKGSNQEGRSLVDTFAIGLDKFGAWLRAARESGDMHKFFKDFGEALREILRIAEPVIVAVGILAIGLLPIFRDNAGLLADSLWLMHIPLKAIVAVLQFLNPLIGPLIVAYMGLRTATLLLAAAEMILTQAFLLSPLGWVTLAVVALAAAFYLLYTKVGWFHRAVDNVFNWIKQNWPLLAAILTGPFAPMTFGIIQAIKHWGDFKHAIGDAMHWAADRIRDFIAFVKRVPGAIWNAIKGAPGKIGGGLYSVGKNAIGSVFHLGPGRAGGGMIPYGTASLVGEHGPELAASGPRGTMITPLSGGLATPSHIGTPSMGDVVEVHSHVTLAVDGREIARADTSARDDKKARRGERP